MNEANMNESNTITKSAGMSEAARIAKREYFRKWKKANRDKVRAYQERYWEKRAQAAEGDPVGELISKQ